MNADECRARRLRLGWTEQELADQAGLSELTIRSFERGLTQPRPGTLIALRRAFSGGEQQLPRDAFPRSTPSSLWPGRVHPRVGGEEPSSAPELNTDA